MKLHIYAHTCRHLRGILAIMTEPAVTSDYVHLTDVEIDASTIPDREAIEALIQQHEAESKAARVADLRRMIAELES